MRQVEDIFSCCVIPWPRCKILNREPNMSHDASSGGEHADDIISDLEQALKKT